MEIEPDITNGSVYLSWGNFPEETVGFKVYKADDQGDPTDYTKNVPETAQLLGTTTNAFFCDMVFFESSIRRRDSYYIVAAFNQSGKIVDILHVRYMPSEHPLIVKRLNAANYAARMFFSNPYWSYEAFILRPRMTGKKCSCMILDFSKSKDPDCDICYGTGYEGGFYTPLPTYILPITHDRTDNAIHEASPTAGDHRQLTLPRFPGVHSKDFVFTDAYGILAVTASSKRTLKSSHTPTIMAPVVSLGTDHPIHKFKFDSLPAAIDSAEINPATKLLTFKGRSLLPVLGTIKLRLYRQDNSFINELSIPSLRHATEDTLVFHLEEAAAYTTQIIYKLYLNNRQLKGNTSL